MLNPVTSDYLRPLYEWVRNRYGSFRYDTLAQIGIAIDWVLFKDCPIYTKVQVDRLDSIMDVRGPVEILQELEGKGIRFADLPEGFAAYFFKLRWPYEKPEVLTEFYNSLVDFLIEDSGDPVYISTEDFGEFVKKWIDKSQWIQAKSATIPSQRLIFVQHWFGNLPPEKPDVDVLIPLSISPPGIDWEKANQLASLL